MCFNSPALKLHSNMLSYGIKVQGVDTLANSRSAIKIEEQLRIIGRIILMGSLKRIIGKFFKNMRIG